MTYLKKRNRKYHYRRRVPRSARQYHSSDYVQVSLQTDSQKLAEERSKALTNALDEYWASVRRDKSADRDVFNDLVNMAKDYGFRYKSIPEVLEQETAAEVLTRLNVAARCSDATGRAAILGSAEPDARLRVSDALRGFLDHESSNLRGYSDSQERSWINSKNRAVRNFVKVVGNKPLNEISREDVLAFREWWSGRLRNEGLTSTSANKELTNVKLVLRLASDNFSLARDFDQLFVRTRFKKQASSRLPFEPEFIRDVLFNRNRIAMNQECQLLIYAMADTGARVGELVGLDFEAGDIVLSHDIPHIKIRPNGVRTLKTAQSERDIPLVGSSLLAFTELKQGFRRYLGKNNLISSTIGKYFRENELLPSTNHSLYSLRHSFEDRLTAVEPPDKVQAALMGHKYSRPRYGLGPSLEQKRLWLDKIALF